MLLALGQAQTAAGCGRGQAQSFSSPRQLGRTRARSRLLSDLGRRWRFSSRSRCCCVLGDIVGLLFLNSMEVVIVLQLINVVAHDRGVSKYLRTFSQVNFIISVINLSMSSFTSSVCIVNACKVRMALIFCGCGILKPLFSIPEFGKACNSPLLESLRPILGDQPKLLLLI